MHFAEPWIMRKNLTPMMPSPAELSSIAGNDGRRATLRQALCTTTIDMHTAGSVRTISFESHIFYAHCKRSLQGHECLMSADSVLGRRCWMTTFLSGSVGHVRQAHSQLTKWNSAKPGRTSRDLIESMLK